MPKTHKIQKIKKFVRRTTLLVAGGLSVLSLACATQLETLLEEARFLMDHCIPSDATSLANCTTATEKTDEAQTIDAGNVDAATLESSARLGLAGFDFLQVAQRLAELQDSAEGDFTQFRALVDDIEAANGRELDLDELTASETPLTAALAGVTADETNEHAFFQLGLIQAIDGFIRPVKIAGSDAVDVADIDATVATLVSDNFLASDNNLVTAGTTDDDILRPIRENFCRCTLNGGFTAACLRDLMRCELSDAGVPEQDYDASGATTRADCNTLADPAGLSDCGGNNTSS